MFNIDEHCNEGITKNFIEIKGSGRSFGRIHEAVIVISVVVKEKMIARRVVEA